MTVSESLPEGVVATAIEGNDWARNEPIECTVSPLQCVSNDAVAPDGSLQVTIAVEVTGASAVVSSVTGVSGGGLPAAHTAISTPVGSGSAPFELRSGFDAVGYDGSQDTQAGGTPYEQTASLSFTTRVDPGIALSEPFLPTEEPKDVVAYLPLGFVGYPQATPKCALQLLEQTHLDFNPESPTFAQYVPACPSTSRVGVVRLGSSLLGSMGSKKAFESITSIFNVQPEGGYPAELGFRYADKVTLIYFDLVRRAGSYQLRATVPGVPLIRLYSNVLTIFGQPGVRDGDPTARAAFLRNPARCSNGPVMTTTEANSWQHPAGWVTGESAAYPQVTGCDLLQFNPSLDVRPETRQADSPSGYEVSLGFPGAAPPMGVSLEPAFKDVKLTLPAGVSVSPGAADGLAGCDATGPNGINIPQGMGHPDEAGEGEAIGPDGLSHLTPGNCPAQSQIADVEVQTPLLARPLSGHLYLATPLCGGAGQAPCSQASATNGELYRGYLEAEGSGVVVKLEGKIAADPATGQLTVSFQDNPQVPIAAVNVRVHGGVRAPLANPQACGTATTTSDLVPWSTPTTPDATLSSSFNIDWDGNGGGCPGLPFAPAFNAGTVTTSAGAFSPFTVTFSRQDREQDLSGVTVRMPPGLLGVLKSVERCPEPQASQGTCPAGSLIGHTTVAAGAGSHPLYVTGQVFLTGPYGGAPFGLSVVVPAKAGPFNLGNVTVRAAIHVDPHTAQITVVSDPFPQIIDGVQLRLKTVNVTVDRPAFIFNPTNCSQQQVTGSITSAQGASSGVASPFAVAGCARLPFKPAFTVSTQAKTSKKNGASLDVKVGYPNGSQANIRSVAVTLPKALPSRLTTIQQACPQATFAANPASCPAGSNIGIATASTPVLSTPVAGPAYLVSHGGAAFPDLVVILQGEGVTLELVGSINIKHGVTSSAFNSLPDAPIGSFELRLPEGPHSGLAAVLPAKARGSLCGTSLVMPTTITGQNGAVIKQNTKIQVTGCPKAKKKAKAKHHKKKRK